MLYFVRVRHPPVLVSNFDIFKRTARHFLAIGGEALSSTVKKKAPLYPILHLKLPTCSERFEVCGSEFRGCLAELETVPTTLASIKHYHRRVNVVYFLMACH